MTEIYENEISVIINALKTQIALYEVAIKNCENIGCLENVISTYVYDIKELKSIISKLKNQ
jgi:hypothetical protein